MRTSVSNELPSILYYRVITPTSEHFTRVGLWVDMEIREGVDYITLLFPDGKRAEFEACDVEAYRAWSKS